MGLRVNSNISSINAQRNLTGTTDRLQKSLQRLSSGLRITRAADNAAELAISENFRSENRILQQAQRNANDGISLLQIAEGALDETSTLLIRMRALSIQAANGTLGAPERQTVHLEFHGLLAEIDRFVGHGRFEDQRLESAIRSIAMAVENTTAANSRIHDFGFAAETAELARNQVLQQAGVSVLSQASVSTQSALALLQ